MWITNTALLMETQITTTKGPVPPAHQHRQLEGQASLRDGLLIFPYSKKTNKTCHHWQKRPEGDHQSAWWPEVGLLTRSSDSWRWSFCRAMALVRVMSRETCRSNRSGSRPLTMAEEVQVQNPTRLPYILMATIHRPIGSKKTPLLYNTLGEIRNTEAGKSAMT